MLVLTTLSLLYQKSLVQIVRWVYVVIFLEKAKKKCDLKIDTYKSNLDNLSLDNLNFENSSYDNSNSDNSNSNNSSATI